MQALFLISRYLLSCDSCLLAHLTEKRFQNNFRGMVLHHKMRFVIPYSVPSKLGIETGYVLHLCCAFSASVLYFMFKISVLIKFELITRMHSSRMRTARTLPYSRGLPGRDPLRQRPPGQRTPPQRTPPPDREPLRQRPPGQRPPGQRTPTETPLDRDPL